LILVRAPHWITAFLFLSSEISAQGVTSSALGGRITTPDGVPLARAIVTVTHEPTGARWRAITQTNGRYSLEHLAVGGPYSIEARAIGFNPVKSWRVFLALGERKGFDITLIRTVSRLQTVVVKTTNAASIGARGPATTVRDSVINALPVRGRDVFQLALLSPLAARSSGGALSIGGQPDRLNALQIDGATNNDLLGNSNLGLVGTPGQSLGVRTLSPESVKELQIVTAPFDVRFGNFAGGLINAVTRSGTNKFEGFAGGWYSGGDLIGRDGDGERGAEFDMRELTLTLSGPIVRNRAGFFLDAGMQREVLPQNVALIGADTAQGRDSIAVGITRRSLARLQQILSQKYGVDAGSGDPFPVAGTPKNLFAKITLQAAVNSHLELSHNYSSNTPDILTYIPLFGCRTRGLFCMTSSSFRLPATVNATRFGFTTSFAGRFENELRIARLRQHNHCVPATTYPGIVVSADRGFLVTGTANFCTGDFQTQDLIEATDNLTAVADMHHLTIGTHAERIRLPKTNGVQLGFRSNWTFSSLDSLAAGIPSRYMTTFRNPARAGGAISDLVTTLVGAYAQDEWSLTSRITVTAGLRMDVPFADHRPARNDALLGALGIDNSVTPSGNTLWSPRVGWNFDVSGDGRAILRGGAGVFAGRPPYKWLDQVYSRTGLETLTLTCTGSSVPAFTLDPLQQPRACGKAATAVAPYINVFDQNFRFPRNLKLAAGFDRYFSTSVLGSADILFTRWLNQFDLVDINLASSATHAVGEKGRALYGAIDASTGRATPLRRAPQFGPVLQVRNNHGDRALAFSLLLRRTFSHGAEVSASYSHIESRDRFSATEDAADMNFGMVPVDGSIEDRRLATSAWSVPHRFSVTGLLPLASGIRVAVFYLGNSGAPYTYVVRGDANADGIGGATDARTLFNDAVYVPAGRDDITVDDADYSELDRIINKEGCLRNSRGKILRRNSCRNPWVNMLNLRASKLLSLQRGRSVELIGDLFNVLSLLGSRWGDIRETIGGSEVTLLELTGYDNARGRGVYRFIPVERAPISNDVSHWRIQIGARLTF
jgi:hypothetical protein